MIVESIAVGMLQVNCYVLGCEETGKGVVVDPGGHAKQILDMVNQLELEIVAIPNTHAHFDHLLGVGEIKQAAGAPFWLHQADEPVLLAARQMVQAWMGYDPGPMPAIDAYIDVAQPLRFGRQELEVRFVPGHSPGSVAFVHHAGKQVISGDVLFAGGVGRFDFPGSHGPTLLRSIREQLLSLPDDYAIYPGHGPATTVGRERRSNPFLQPGSEFMFEM